MLETTQNLAPRFPPAPGRIWAGSGQVLAGFGEGLGLYNNIIAQDLFFKGVWSPYSFPYILPAAQGGFGQVLGRFGQVLGRF